MSIRAALPAGVLALALVFAVNGVASANATDQIARGKYLLHAGGCSSCHTASGDNALPLAGGLPLETPFGTFYSPNITADPETGIGNWTDDEFVAALWDGVGPDGDYYPAFPYTSYTGMSREDALALKAYLFSLPPASQPNIEHDLDWYLFSRLSAWAWKLLNFTPGRFVPDATQEAPWNRGAYLVRHVGHCGECHSPRDNLGKIVETLALAGNPNGPENKKVPDITSNRKSGIGRWSLDEIELFLEMGMMPDGDFAGGSMSPVIDDNTGQLTREDRHAITVYLQSVPPSET